MVEKVTVIYRKRGIFSKEVGGAAVNYNNGDASAAKQAIRPVKFRGALTCL